MNKQIQRLFVFAFMLLAGLAWTTNVNAAEFKDFSVIVNNQTGTLLTTDEQVQGTPVSFGVAVDDEGTVSRVAADDASAVATVSGKYHSDHGCTNLQVVTAVSGPVKILVGQCTYSSKTISVKNSNGETVVTATPTAACWKNNRSNVTELVYEGDATTLTISGMDYCPYVAVEAIENSSEAWTYHDFAIDMVNILTAEQRVDGTNYEFGVNVAEDGTLTQVAADAENANVVLKGKYHNSHGWTGTTATVRVEGPVQIDLGNCYYGSGTVTVKNANNETVGTGTLSSGNTCWDQDHTSIVSVKYTGEATTLTISYNSYLPYIAVTAIEATAVNVSYSKGDVVCQGDILPTGGTYAQGDSYTIPAQNYTLYKEGYTLTGWTDGSNTYAAGATVTLENDLELTPVFTENEVALADRTEAVTVKFNFRRDQGAPIVKWENTSGVWVAQATVNGTVIDVPMNVNTSPGKFNNANNTDWIQVNNGTTFTIPSCKDATVSMEAYYELSTTTIDGQSDYTSGKTISYQVANTAETVDVVIGSDAGYMRYVQVVLPMVQSQGGTTYTDADATVIWPMASVDGIANYTTTPEDAFSTVAINTGDITLNGTGTGQATYPDGSLVSFVKLRPNGETTSVEWSVKPAAGLTFTPTRISAYIQRFGTDQSNGITISAKTGDGEPLTLGDFTAPRNNKTQSEDMFGTNDNYTNHFEIELDEDQQEFLTSADILTVIGTVGVPAGKDGGYAEMTIEGLLNGTVSDVNKYTLTIAAAPEEGGTVSAYPAAEEYEEGTEVTLTATENFGYDFVNWTDAAGEVVSTEAKFKYTVNGDAELTANFVAVETYELALTVDGTNDYMVTVSPEPTMVDGKMMYEAGTNVVLTANQYVGLVTFTNWSDNTTNSELTVTMDGDKDITATYAEADIIAGWDFYKEGKNGRVADFSDENNTATALNLVNTETGSTSAWLDKSTVAAGGYEGLAGAAVNWTTGTKDGDVGHYHWQTKINAEAFKDINVQFQMLYNYNAYQTYNVEYSLDGVEWTGFGSITMTGAKAVASFAGQMPAAADNQTELYIRMIADKESDVVGAASKNDGNTLAMFFITGNPQLVDDGQAPELVSTVPENGATGASASGKIVLTFDERVKVADGVVGMLDGVELTPTVSGKTVSFVYKGLDYASDYIFELPANSVSDLTDNVLEEAITITFTTMVRPSVTKGLYDWVVPTDGSLEDAIAAANSRSDKNTRYRIFLMNGTYTLPISTTATISSDDGNSYASPITNVTASNISFIGESRDGVIITNLPDGTPTFAGTYGTTSVYDGIGKSDVLQLSGSDTYFQDLTVKSGIDDALGRNIAVQDRGTKTIYKNVYLHGYQDTWTSNKQSGLYYFEGGVVRGRTDFLCGKGDAFFNGVELRQIAGGYLAVPSQPANIGWVFSDCVINGEPGVVNYAKQQTVTASDADGNYTLGRPWGQGTPIALYINTTMNVVPSPIGWSEMGSDGYPARFAEYNSVTSTGATVDLSGRKTTFGSNHTNNPVLTAEEAAVAADMGNMFGDWQPTLYTEQAPVPTDVVLAGTTLSWTGSDYALLYAICKDGSVIGFTIEESYTVEDVDAVYTIRAANEMGGLSEQSEEAVVAPATVTITIGERGAASFSSIYPLDFTGSDVKAYIITEKNGNYIMRKNVTMTPANTGLVVEAAAGTYEVNVATTAVDALEDVNLLVATSEGPYTVTEEDYGFIYGLFYSTEKERICFQKKKVGWTCGEGKSYLRTTTANANEFIYPDETTGINTVDADQQINQPLYNLNGQRVNRSYKGVVITDGKKQVRK
ncbi:MAG: Ig-like domain-containing protein [Prevotella sp.]|nr:Ig-like domain-containing protein [Prevotella sp.]